VGPGAELAIAGDSAAGDGDDVATTVDAAVEDRDMPHEMVEQAIARIATSSEVVRAMVGLEIRTLSVGGWFRGRRSSRVAPPWAEDPISPELPPARGSYAGEMHSTSFPSGSST
jgi:hypothetical protein